MALDPAEKQRRKDEQKIRNRLHTARNRKRRREEEAAEAEVKRRLEPAYLALKTAEDALRTRWDAYLAAIDAEIKRLQQQREQVDAGYRPQYQQAREATQDSWRGVRNAVDEAKAVIAARYPDMTGAAWMSAAAWGETEVGRAMLKEELQKQAGSPGAPSATEA